MKQQKGILNYLLLARTSSFIKGASIGIPHIINDAEASKCAEVIQNRCCGTWRWLSDERRHLAHLGRLRLTHDRLDRVSISTLPKVPAFCELSAL